MFCKDGARGSTPAVARKPTPLFVPSRGRLMPHDTALIATIAAGLGLAFLFGLLASRLRLPPILGYLLAGVALGPFTPGFVADAGLASQLAEIGVILLMFGVGLHFSIADLLARSEEHTSELQSRGHLVCRLLLEK